MRKNISRATFALALGWLMGCNQTARPQFPAVPSVDYTNQVKYELGGSTTGKTLGSKYSPNLKYGQQAVQAPAPSTMPAFAQNPTAQDEARLLFAAQQKPIAQPDGGPMANLDSNYETNMGSQQVTPVSSYPGDYNGPLSLGDPGVSASLWRDSSGTPDFFRDTRAWQPMDLITIIISESAEGKKEADTEIKSKSTIDLAIQNLLGYQDNITESNPDIDLEHAIQASSQNNFKGEGETNRKDDLKGTLSAMVVEVLPSGILRIEGTKIISVNYEEQVMVLSGLVRPRDISAINEIQSSRIANMRIDYYGSGQVGAAQKEGWLGHIIRKVWPF